MMPVQLQETVFGDRLRREREMRGVSLEELSVATRIPPRYLEAIETEQWELLPGRVFNRGYVRAIAQFIGLSEDDMLADYELASRPALEAAAPPPKAEEPPPRDLTPLYLFVGGCVVLLVLLGVSVHMLRPRVANWLKSKSAHASAAEPLPMPAVPAADSPPPMVADAPAAAPAIIPAAAKTSPAAATPATVASTASSAPTKTSAPAPPPTASKTSVVPAVAPVVAAPVSAANPEANADGTNSAAAGTLQLKVEVTKKTKVMVNGDGRVLVSRSLSPGDTRTFQASDHFDVAAKNPDAVRLELNGHLLPPLVSSAGRWNATLNQDSLKKAAGGPH
jgi:cytoskeleton protein RodZ